MSVVKLTIFMNLRLTCYGQQSSEINKNNLNTHNFYFRYHNNMDNGVVSFVTSLFLGSRVRFLTKTRVLISGNQNYKSDTVIGEPKKVRLMIYK